MEIGLGSHHTLRCHDDETEDRACPNDMKYGSRPGGALEHGNMYTLSLSALFVAHNANGTRGSPNTTYPDEFHEQTVNEESIPASGVADHHPVRVAC